MLTSCKDLLEQSLNKTIDPYKITDPKEIQLYKETIFSIYSDIKYLDKFCDLYHSFYNFKTVMDYDIYYNNCWHLFMDAPIKEEILLKDIYMEHEDQWLFSHQHKYYATAAGERTSLFRNSSVSKNIDKEGLNKLRPIPVCIIPDDINLLNKKYYPLDGGHRYFLSRILKAETIKCIVFKTTNQPLGEPCIKYRDLYNQMKGIL